MGPESQPPSAVLWVMQKCSCQVSTFPDVKEISVFNADLSFLQTKQTVSTCLCSVGSAQGPGGSGNGSPETPALSGCPQSRSPPGFSPGIEHGTVLVVLGTVQQI